MEVLIQALELTMTPEEIKSKLTKEQLESMKGKGVLQAYTVAHEGKSRPRVIGEGTQTLHWTKAVIRRLTEKIKKGTKFFVGHGTTNDHDGRREVGTVLTSFLKEIGGKLSNVIIGYFPNADAVKEMDAVSMEAEINVDDDNVVGDVDDVTGIALGNSERDNPAFPGALRLSSVQCFDTDENKTLEKEKKKMEVTFQDVMTFVKEHNVWPHQLFDEDNLKNDRVFSKLFDSNTAMKLENEKLKKELDETKEKVSTLQKETSVALAKEKLKELMPKDLTDKQKTFISNKFDPSSFEEISDETIKKYIEDGRKDFAETAKLFGVADGSQSGTKTTEESTSDDLGAGESSPENDALKLIGVE